MLFSQSGILHPDNLFDLQNNLNGINISLIFCYLGPIVLFGSKLCVKQVLLDSLQFRATRILSKRGLAAGSKCRWVNVGKRSILQLRYFVFASLFALILC